MDSESNPKLPVIDFNKLDLGDHQNPNEWEEVKSQVFKALKEYGCFEALFDKVPLDLRKSFFTVLKQLFDLSLQTKLSCVFENPSLGYTGPSPHQPLLETTGIDDAIFYEKVESIEKNLWPEGNPNFSKVIQSFSEKLSELDQIVRKMILESLDIEKYLEEHINSTHYFLKVLKYKGPPTENAELGVPPHTDKSTVTILCQNEVDGLEIETKDGKWITYQPSSPHSFVVMIGDYLHAWTNGRVHSPFHRVMMKGNEARYSVGLFSVPKGEYIIKAPEELVDEEHPLLYKPFDHAGFIKYYYNEEAHRRKYGLKIYCGL